MSDRERVILETVLSNDDGVAALVDAFREKQQQWKDSFWALDVTKPTVTLEAEAVRIKGVVEGLEVAIALISQLATKTKR